MAMDSGTYWVRIPKIFMGKGALDSLGALAVQLGATKILIMTDAGLIKSGLIEKVTEPLKKQGLPFDIYDQCKADAPLSAIRRAAQYAADGKHDLIIGVGGGSVMDTVKAVSLSARAKDVARLDMEFFTKELKRGIPTILIATTAGTGSEVSHGAIITDDLSDAKGVKKSVVSNYTMPEVAIVDPLLTQELPPEMTADTGMDALSHAVEGYTHVRANLIADMFAEKTFELVSRSLRSCFHGGPVHLEARYEMAVAATLGILSFGTSGGPNLTHGIGHSLQTIVHCTHGKACSVILPHVMEFNMPAYLSKFAKMAELMGQNTLGVPLRDAAQGAVNAVRNLSIDVGMPQRLRDLGMKKGEIADVVEVLFKYNLRVFANNPRACSREQATAIIEAAW